MQSSLAGPCQWTNKEKKISTIFADTQVHVNISISMCFYNLFFKHYNFNQHYFTRKLDAPCQAATFQYFWWHALTKTFKKFTYNILLLYDIYNCFKYLLQWSGTLCPQEAPLSETNKDQLFCGCIHGHILAKMRTLLYCIYCFRNAKWDIHLDEAGAGVQST